jgi:flagellar biosynthesis anti-sigma factor FlgM
MKIDPSQQTPSIAKDQGLSALSKSQGAAASGSLNYGPMSEDSASLSALGNLASRLQATTESRIQSLRKQVQEGTYSVDATQISRKLVDSMLED